MNWWMKVKALPIIWRDMEDILELVALSPAIRSAMEMNNQVMRDGIEVVQAQRDEIARMNQVAEQDARLLLAYARWCQKNGCAPSSSDLMDMVK